MKKTLTILIILLAWNCAYSQTPVSFVESDIHLSKPYLFPNGDFVRGFTTIYVWVQFEKHTTAPKVTDAIKKEMQKILERKYDSAQLEVWFLNEYFTMNEYQKYSKESPIPAESKWVAKVSLKLDTKCGMIVGGGNGLDNIFEGSYCADKKNK